MRSPYALAFAVLLTAACSTGPNTASAPSSAAPSPLASIDGSSHTYPTPLITSFVNMCAAAVGMSRPMCQCAAEAVQERWTLDEFIALQRALAAGTASNGEKQQIADITTACLPATS